ncbi:hypothetical protein [Streptomyces yaizuensis]|uniref:Uncharacterized protein n=1 Tax=Streptomyces yaizuensis TaxID=2989713 RepID=A0ABQ5P6V4_9ACTN|nr:hypothetical protein [Streptomyces sp. YSPA8]GLF98213.1 hypothetical protein SYYSPA8_27970 [Streptomyces sp. YSPA8]
MPTVELTDLLSHATDDQADAIRAAAHTAGVLWKCRNAACATDDLPRSARRCALCGFDREGEPIGDKVSYPYGPVPGDLLTALRGALVEWFTEHGRPRPDAVTFAYTNENGGAHDCSDWGVLHFGGRTEPSCDFSGTEVAEALIQLTDFEVPFSGAEMTVALPR